MSTMYNFFSEFVWKIQYIQQWQEAGKEFACLCQQNDRPLGTLSIHVCVCGACGCHWIHSLATNRFAICTSTNCDVPHWSMVRITFAHIQEPPSIWRSDGKCCHPRINHFYRVLSRTRTYVPIPCTRELHINDCGETDY